MHHDPSAFEGVRASQPAHFWVSSITVHVDGELTMFDFEHERAGRVISTEAARELYRSLGEQLSIADSLAALQDRIVKAEPEVEVKSPVRRSRARWRAKPRALRSAA